MFVRAVLAYLLAVPVFVLTAARATDGVPDYTLVVTITTSVSGVLQVYYDTGRGFREDQSLTEALRPGVEPREYSWRLQANRYHDFRIDPGNVPGRYALHRVAILDAQGSVVKAFPLDQIAPLYHLRVVERTGDRLLVETPENAADPQLLCASGGELQLFPQRRIVPAVAGRFAVAWLLAFGTVRLLSVLLRSWTPSATRIVDGVLRSMESYPRTAITGAALAATLVSTYPIVFLGRSFVSPNNGEARMLYDRVPFVPGSTDLTIEPSRKGDTAAAMYAFAPYAHMQRAALSHGEWPLWNRYATSGRPLWGQGQTFLLDPLHWIVMLTPDLAWGLDLKFIAHRLVFAVGIGLTAFAVTGAAVPAAVAGASAPFLGTYAFRLNHPATFALTYAPWVLLGWFSLGRAYDRHTRARASLLLALATSLTLLASPPKEAVVTIAAMWLTGAASVVLSAGGWAVRARVLLWASLAGLAAILVTAPHWLVFLDTLRQSTTAYDKPDSLFAGLPYTVSFFLGTLAPGDLRPGTHALVLVLVAAAIASPTRILKNPAALACAAVGATVTAVAFGAIPDTWLNRLPFLAHIVHVHDVFLTPVLPLVLIVGAVGAAALLSGGLVRAVVVAVLCAALGWRLLIRVAFLAPPSSFEPFAAFGVLSIAALLPLVTTARVLRAGPLSPVAAILAAILLVLPGGMHVEAGVPALDALLAQPRLRVSLERASPAVEVVRDSVSPSRVSGIEWAVFPGSQALYGLEGIGGPDALALPLFDQLVDAARIWRGWSWVTIIEPDDVARLAPLLDLLNVEFLLNPGKESPPSGIISLPVPGADRLQVWRRTTVWPRAFFVDGATTYGDPAGLLRDVAAHGRPMAAILGGDRRALDATRDLQQPSGVVVPATAYQLDANTTRFRLQTASAGIAVLTESFLPDDFRASLNGRRVDYFRVNHAFKGVVIPSGGDWEVAFVYRPARWNLSLAMGAAGLVLLAGLALQGRPLPPVIARASRAVPLDT